MSVATKLQAIHDAISAMKLAIVSKGQDLTDVPLSGWADKIDAIESGGGDVALKPFFGESGVVVNKEDYKRLFIVFKKHPVGYTEDETATITIKHCATETGLFTEFAVLVLPYSGSFGNSKVTDVDITTMDEWFQIVVEYGEDGEVFSTLLILADTLDVGIGAFTFPLDPMSE